MLKLNLGCGKKKLEGFVNVDFADADVVHDLTQPLPFEAGSADEVHAYHVAEHFYRWEIEAILADWVRVLKPGGKLVLEMPCLDKILSLFDHFIANREPVPEWVMWGLYGDPRYKNPAMCHRWGYAEQEMTWLMQRAGLEVTTHEAQTHVAARDMRLEGIKP